MATSTESPRQRCVMLGDVVESRRIADRAAFGDRLAAALATVNETYDTVHAPFDTLRGIDEIGGVLTDVADSYAISAAINVAVAPQRLRFAVATGGIDLHADSGDVGRMDGPAFHAADVLLQRVEDAGLHFGLDTGDAWADRLLAGQVNLLYLFRGTWTAKQAAAMDAYERTGSQSAAAAELGVTQQTVSERLQAIRWRQFGHLERTLNRCLAAYADGRGVDPVAEG